MLLEGKALQSMVDRVLSPRLVQYGMRNNGHYTWIGENLNSIRRVFEYVALKGGQGTFRWGVCFDFIPTIYGSTLKYHRTEKTVVMHLFDWPEEYARSFFRGKIGTGMASHWEKDKPERSVGRLFDRCEKKMLDFYNETSTIEKSLALTEFQIREQKSYSLHSPNPSYVLPFLLFKNGQTDKALLAWEQLPEMNQQLIEKIKKRILS
ncbi:MAG: hypothetical protein Q8932_21680 [Bacteroidota bacterium]|nr:hypothetical protein [Bacteroidota bacterium]MDP4248452.1 hypothetical protein [Bacteroidota bacterium]MDP4254144.1 hypothetical protein [Bacteroidota bacterium]MDP4259644.1 hypothetical protein [Bacteroidota bacterium]